MTLIYRGLESELVALAPTAGSSKGLLEVCESNAGTIVSDQSPRRNNARTLPECTFAQRMCYRRRQDDVVLHKEIARGRVAVRGHALARDLVNVPRLGDARPREIDLVAVKVRK